MDLRDFAVELGRVGHRADARKATTTDTGAFIPRTFQDGNFLRVVEAFFVWDLGYLGEFGLKSSNIYAKDQKLLLYLPKF